MTGTLERPSQGAPENRKAADHRRQDTDLKKGARRALAALADADMQLLVAGQQQVRRQALSSIDAALGASHASQRAAVVARYGNRRSALGSIADAGTRNAALLQLIAEEAAELARLALALADDKQRLKRETVAAMVIVQRGVRQAVWRKNRHGRLAMAISQQPPRRSIVAETVERQAVPARFRHRRRLPTRVT